MLAELARQDQSFRDRDSQARAERIKRFHQKPTPAAPSSSSPAHDSHAKDIEENSVPSPSPDNRANRRALAAGIGVTAIGAQALNDASGAGAALVAKAQAMPSPRPMRPLDAVFRVAMGMTAFGLAALGVRKIFSTDDTLAQEISDVLDHPVRQENKSYIDAVVESLDHDFKDWREEEDDELQEQVAFRLAQPVADNHDQNDTLLNAFNDELRHISPEMPIPANEEMVVQQIVRKIRSTDEKRRPPTPKPANDNIFTGQANPSLSDGANEIEERRRILQEGMTFGVLLPNPDRLAKDFLEKLLRTANVTSISAPDYENVYLVLYTNKEGSVDKTRLTGPSAEVKISELPYRNMPPNARGFLRRGLFTKRMVGEVSYYSWYRRSTSAEDAKKIQDEFFREDDLSPLPLYDFHQELFLESYKVLSQSEARLADFQDSMYRNGLNDAWANGDLDDGYLMVAYLAYWKTQPQELERIFLPLLHKLNPPGKENLPALDPKQVLTDEEQKAFQLLRRFYPYLGQVEIERFEIDGAISFDIFFARSFDGRIVLYIPGDEKPFTGHRDEAALKTWISRQCTSPQRIKELAQHFTVHQQQPSSSDEWTGVYRRLALLGASVLTPPSPREQASYLAWINSLAASERTFSGNIFESLVKSMLTAYSANVNSLTTTHTERQRQSLLDTSGLLLQAMLPLGLYGLPISAIASSVHIILAQKKASTGDTEKDRLAGLSGAMQAGFDFLDPISEIQFGGIFKRFISTRRAARVAQKREETIRQFGLMNQPPKEPAPPSNLPGPSSGNIALTPGQNAFLATEFSRQQERWRLADIQSSEYVISSKAIDARESFR